MQKVLAAASCGNSSVSLFFDHSRKQSASKVAELIEKVIAVFVKHCYRQSRVETDLSGVSSRILLRSTGIFVALVA